jgi:hypothetical protein
MSDTEANLTDEQTPPFDHADHLRNYATYNPKLLFCDDLRAAADEIDRLRLENANLREQLAGHQREAMIREAQFEPEQGPCRPDEFNDPHVWDRSAMWDDVEECSRCGTECGK